jgi:rRNA-processing protein FCF1
MRLGATLATSDTVLARVAKKAGVGVLSCSILTSRPRDVRRREPQP